MKSKIKVSLILMMIAMITLSCSSLETSGVKLNPETPVTITLWHYYSATQQEALNQLVNEFNETKGSEIGIVVNAISQGSFEDLVINVTAAIEKKVGAEPVPNIFSVYADTVYNLRDKNMLADLKPYFSDDELSKYIKGYIEEGYVLNDNRLLILPIAKATEIFVLNKTDWEVFAKANDVSSDSFATFEGITRVAEQYYNWTDNLTPEPNDGKAFFGRDAMANYLYIGTKQLGHELFTMQDGKPTLQLDSSSMRKIWDNYYIPFIHGYFSAEGRFRSDSMKTGTLLAFIGSSSSAAYLPNVVTKNDLESYPIKIDIYESPRFVGGENYAIQQGAGMAVANLSEKEVYASVEFLKWLTQKDKNLSLALSSTYLPVTYEANEKDVMKQAVFDSSQNESAKDALLTAAETASGRAMYAPSAFENSANVRHYLETCLSDKSKADRELVLASLAEGNSLENAVAPYITDENFENWFQDLKTNLEAMLP